MNKKIYLAVIVLSSFFFSNFQSAFAQPGDAGQPGEFLRYGVGARALGLGRAFTALANDASALYWNPAGLIGVERKEFTSQYANLFYDSRYTFMAVVLPRTLTGSSNALGFGWVNLTMAEFDQRDKNNQPLGNFDIYQQAFILAGAREWVSTWGILNYGLDLKLVNQAFLGYDAEPGGDSGKQDGWGFGADVGVTMVPINLPVLKIVTLRYLMPLRLGAVLQNLLPPRLGIGDSQKDRYPTILRWGGSYRIDMCKNIFSQLTFDHFNLLLDQEIFLSQPKRPAGWFGGVEAVFLAADFQPCLRLGLNNRTEKITFGGGLKFGFTDNAAIRLDYAWSRGGKLNNDSRLFLTMEFGRNYDADYFAGKPEKKMADHLQVIARYPNNKAVESAERLGGELDPVNAKRYFQLIGGLRWADELYLEAVKTLRSGNENAACGQARAAVAEYDKAIRKTPAGSEIAACQQKRRQVGSVDTTFVKERMKSTTEQLLNYAEACLIAGNNTKAVEVLNSITVESLRKEYLLGIAYQRQQDWQSAKNAFIKATQFTDDSRSMRTLAQFGLGEVLIKLGEYQAAIMTLQDRTVSWHNKLKNDYPRLPIHPDACFNKLGKTEEAERALAKIERFFPGSQRTRE